MQKNFRYTVIILSCVGLAIFLTSCSGKSRKPVFPVHGQVFDKDNKPAVGALVIFHPTDNSDPNTVKPLARVDEKGNFTLTTYEKNDGGPEGEYAITIQWRLPPANPFGGEKEGPDRLKGRYNDPKTSTLKFKIANQPDNIVPPIRLQ
jgi:hypothetical protein